MGPLDHFCSQKGIFILVMMNDHKLKKTSEVVLYLSKRTLKPLGGFCGVGNVLVGLI